MSRIKLRVGSVVQNVVQLSSCDKIEMCVEIMFNFKSVVKTAARVYSERITEEMEEEA